MSRTYFPGGMAQIRMYDKLVHNTTGRTAVAMRDETINKFSGRQVVWLAWDDAASYPRFVRTEQLTFVGEGTSQDLVVYSPGAPGHGKTRGELGLEQLPSPSRR